MPLLDSQGRIFGKANLFDLFLVVVLIAVVALAYQRLTIDYRVAPPYATGTLRVVVTVDLQLPEAHAWLAEEALPGLTEIDPRSGEARAEVLGHHMEDGIPLVSLKLFAVRDGAGRVLFEGSPLLPGRMLEINTESLILEGVVRRMQPEESP